MMSGKEVDPECCVGLTEHEFDLSQGLDPVQTGFTNPACAVLADPECCVGLKEHEFDLSHGPDPMQTGFTNPACAVLVPEKIPLQDAGGNSHEPHPNVEEVFNIEKWVFELNQNLLDHQGKAAAQTTFLINAKEMCDDRIQKLTSKFLQSESDLKTELKKYPTKKAQKKILRIFDPELRSINKEVEQTNHVRRQVESRLVQVTGLVLEDQPLIPIQVAGERKACAGQRQKFQFCTDLLLCLLLSCLIFALLFLLMTKYLTFPIV